MDGLVQGFPSRLTKFFILDSKAIIHSVGVKENWILVLETSVTQATLLLAKNGEICTREDFSSERSQECDLFAPLTTLLQKLPAAESLSAVVVGTGPGSYNGARVGIAAAQAIAQTHGCRVAGICSFESVGGNFAVGDARRGSYFVLEFEQERIVNSPHLLSKEEFAEYVETHHGEYVTFESPERLPEGVTAIQRQSTAEGLLKAWLNRSPEEKEALLKKETEAFYLRPPHITKSKKVSPMQR